MHIMPSYSIGFIAYKATHDMHQGIQVNLSGSGVRARLTDHCFVALYSSYGRVLPPELAT